MKKIALISFAAIAALMSCQKEGLVEIAQTDEPLVFTASIAADQTKTTLSDDSPAKIKWEATDCITITDASSHQAVYMLSTGAGTSKATFTKKSGDDLDNPGTYTATYGSAPSTSQVYMASGSVPLYMTAPSTTSTDGLCFTAQCGVLRVTLTDATHQIMRVEASDGINTYKVTAASEVTVTSATDFFIALPAGTYTSLNIYDNNGQMVSKTGISLAITAGHVKPAGNTSALSFTACTTKGFIGGHAVVQLWSGGPFWAETNIGAANDTDYGYYFAWGYSEGCVRNSANDGWVLVSDGATVKQFNNYTGNFPNRATGTFQDAATAAWGTSWSVPTDTDLSNLLNTTNTTVEYVRSGSAHWSTYNVKGILVTGKGDYISNSIFFPNAGHGANSDLINAGVNGSYWSSVQSAAGYAYYLFFNPTYDSSSVNNDIKEFGNPIRPVRSSI